MLKRPLPWLLSLGVVFGSRREPELPVRACRPVELWGMDRRRTTIVLPLELMLLLLCCYRYAHTPNVAEVPFSHARASGNKHSSHERYLEIRTLSTDEGTRCIGNLPVTWGCQLQWSWSGCTVLGLGDQLKSAPANGELRATLRRSMLCLDPGGFHAEPSKASP